MSAHYTCEVEGCGKQTNNLAEWMTLTITGCVESIAMHACCVAHMQVVCGNLAAAMSWKSWGGVRLKGWEHEWMTLTITGCVESIVMHACCVAHMQVVCGSLAAAAAQHVAKPKEPWDP